MNTKIQRLTAAVLIASLVSTAHAGLINQAAPTDRERIASHVEREDVAAELVARGISREDANARVAALTDAEAASLAGRLDELPAGGFVQLLLVPWALVGVALMAPVVAVGVVVVGAVGIAKGIAYLSEPRLRVTAPLATVKESPRTVIAGPETYGLASSSTFPPSGRCCGVPAPAATTAQSYRHSDPSPFPTSGWYQLGVPVPVAQSTGGSK